MVEKMEERRVRTWSSSAGVMSLAGGVDLVALDEADVLLLVVAMGEGDAGDMGLVAGFGFGDVLNDGGGVGLPGAGGGGGVRDDAEVKVGAGEGGCGKGILGHGDYGAEAGAARGGAGVEVEGADLAVGVREGPGSRVVEGEMVGGVVEGVGGTRIDLRK